MTRIGVIGHKGFLGRNFIQNLYLEDKTRLLLWDRIHHGNFLNKEDRLRFLQEKNLGITYQFAWESTESQFYKSNSGHITFAKASISFAKECFERNIKVVLIGSLDKNTSTKYGQSKLFLYDFLRSHKLSNTILFTPPYILSLKDRRPHILRSYFEWIDKGHEDNLFPIHFPDKKINFLHIKDIATRLTLLNKSIISNDSLFIESYGRTITLREFINLARIQINNFHKNSTINFEAVSKQITNLTNETDKFIYANGKVD